MFNSLGTFSQSNTEQYVQDYRVYKTDIRTEEDKEIDKNVRLLISGLWDYGLLLFFIFYIFKFSTVSMSYIYNRETLLQKKEKKISQIPNDCLSCSLNGNKKNIYWVPIWSQAWCYMLYIQPQKPCGGGVLKLPFLRYRTITSALFYGKILKFLGHKDREIWRKEAGWGGGRGESLKEN